MVQQSPKIKVKKQKTFPKDTINIIRTTLRNNIELTGIADNKASVLLSLNAIILTFALPLISAYSQQIMETKLFIPLILLSITCFLTIYYAARVLKPSDFNQPRNSTNPKISSSPFFFGNFYKMNADDYYLSLREGLQDPQTIHAHLAQDLYYTGKRLGRKMTWIRFAFNLFTGGIFLSLLTTAIVLFSYK